MGPALCLSDRLSHCAHRSVLIGTANSVSVVRIEERPYLSDLADIDGRRICDVGSATVAASGTRHEAIHHCGFPSHDVVAASRGRPQTSARPNAMPGRGRRLDPVRSYSTSRSCSDGRRMRRCGRRSFLATHQCVKCKDPVHAKASQGLGALLNEHDLAQDMVPQHQARSEQSVGCQFQMTGDAVNKMKFSVVDVRSDESRGDRAFPLIRLVLDRAT